MAAEASREALLAREASGISRLFSEGGMLVKARSASEDSREAIVQFMRNEDHNGNGFNLRLAKESSKDPLHLQSEITVSANPKTLDVKIIVESESSTKSIFPEDFDPFFALQVPLVVINLTKQHAKKEIDLGFESEISLTELRRMEHDAAVLVMEYIRDPVEQAKYQRAPFTFDMVSFLFLPCESEADTSSQVD